MSDWLEPGSPMPSFTLPDHSGTKVKSSQWKGKPLVIYFYPKDDTPGCTQEACDFRDASHSFEKLGAAVVGISCDPPESHAKFRHKYELNFPLLSDSEHQVAEEFGAWREKNMYGKKSMGVQRSTFLIGPDGKVAKVWKRVQVAGHADAVLNALTELTAK